MQFTEPQFERAVQRRLRRNPPFSDDDLAHIEALALLFPRDLSDVVHFPMLRTLNVIGYGGRDLAALADHSRLASLSLRFSALADVSAVPTMPMISRLKLPLNAIQDATALLSGLPELREVDLTGNPLSEESYHEVVPALRQRVRESVAVSEEREWQITRKLHAAGIPFDYFRQDDTYLLCRPGLEFTDTPDAGHARIEPADLEAMLQRDPKEIHELFTGR